jgi:uncharacterized protein (TIGR02145 family)
MRNLIPILLALVVLSSGCDPDGYSCNSEGCYAENNAQYLTLEDCLSICDEQIPGGCGSPVLHEGYIYSTIQIGNQCWFSENCRFLPSVSLSSTGSNNDSYYYVYDYTGTDLAVAKATSNYETYGVLYNWSAAMSLGVCPTGWHVPTVTDVTQLTDFLGLDSEAGYAMKSTSGWADYNSSTGNGSNSSGFTGVPGGYHTPGGAFSFGSQVAMFWSSTTPGGSSQYATSWGLSYNHPDVHTGPSIYELGHSVRCVRD